MTRRAYIRSTDQATMVEVKPRQYVNLKVARLLGLIGEKDKVEVK